MTSGRDQHMSYDAHEGQGSHLGDADPRTGQAPPRGFSDHEFADRLRRAQEAMTSAGIDALLVTLPEQIRYFTGFHTQLWTSPTRPWFTIVPRLGDAPIAVVPEAGRSGMEEAFTAEVRSWASPHPPDDGVTLLADALRSVAGGTGRVGAELGGELQVRMPLQDFQRVIELSGTEVVDGTAVIRACRQIKSEAEIAKIRHICQLASASFGDLPGHARAGISEREVARAFTLDLLSRGADSVPFAIASAGKGGYGSITMGPSDRVLAGGDVFFLDTGGTFDGYFCDFDRNWTVGQAGEQAARAHEVVWRATEAGLAAARPGVRCEDVWRAMVRVLDEANSLGNTAGRLGHGLGMQLTEPPSLAFGDDTILQPGMVLTIEPGMEFARGKMMVHEENIVVRDGEPELLTTRAPAVMPQLDA